MARATHTEPRRRGLTRDEIVAKALVLIDQHGVGGLSMRRLGKALDVDPMAIYHHVENRETLIALALDHVLQTMPAPDPNAEWDDQVRTWAHDYRSVVAAHRSLTYEALRNPVSVDLAAKRATQPLVDAIASGGLPDDRAVALADLVVDYIHGHALAAIDDATDESRPTFDLAIETILDGVRTRAR